LFDDIDLLSLAKTISSAVLPSLSLAPTKINDPATFPKPASPQSLPT